MRAASPLLVILLLWGAGLGAAAQFGKVSVLFARVAQDYPDSGAVMLGLIVSVVGLVGLVFGTMAGLMVQGLGYRRVLVWALASGALFSALQAPMPPLALMIVLRIAEGFSHLAIVVAAPVLIAQVAPLRFQGLAMTLWSSFFAVSFAVTAALGLPLVERFGSGALFLAHGAYMAVFALAILRVLPGEADPVLPSLRPGAVLHQHGAIYASPFTSAPALGFCCYTLTYVALLTLLPPMVGGGWQGFVATAMPLVSIIVSLTLGVWLLGRVSAVRIVQGGFAVTVLAAAVIWGSPGAGMVMVGAALVLAASLGVVQGASFAAIPQLNPEAEGRARAAGAIAQLGNLGTTTGTPLLAALIASQGATGLALFVALPSLVGIALHEWLARRRAAAE
ncbi:MAG: MFS transporter [Pseudorhodobacter sp.]